MTLLHECSGSREIKQTLFKTTYVHTHELCHERLQVEDGFAAKSKPGLVNPQRMCEGMVVIRYVCVSVCYKLKVRCHRVLYGIFKVSVIWLSLKMLRSNVLASFVDHHCLPRSLTSSRQTKETAMASIQFEECV